MGLDYNKILLKALTGKVYFSNEDLRINKQYGYLFNRYQLEEYLDFKESYESLLKNKLDLKAFNSTSLYYYNAKELTDSIFDYSIFFKDDILVNNSTIVIENYEEMILSQPSSELEGTLKIEGVNTPRKKV